MSTKKVKKHTVLEEIQHITAKLDGLEQVVFKIFNQTYAQQQELDKKHREDHMLMLSMNGQFEDIKKNMEEWKVARRTVSWCAVIIVIFTIYFILKDN